MEIDAHYMALAFNEAQKATCDRARVGCVLIDVFGHVVGIGYNSAPRNSPTCDAVGHLIHDGHCCRTTHAEIVALSEAAWQGATVARGATAYLTHAPCIGCAHALIAHGVARVVYANAYRLNEATAYVFTAAGVTLEQWKETNDASK
jgi:dCMP deaminase